MKIIKPATLAAFWESRPDLGEAERARRALVAWGKVVAISYWRTFSEVRETFPSADQVGRCVVFNVGGNRYRLVATILYERTRPRRNPAIPGPVRQRTTVLVRKVMDHREYDDGAWIGECGRDEPKPRRGKNRS